MKFPIKFTLTLTKHILKNKLIGNKYIPLVLMLEPSHACNLNCSGCGRIREYSNSINSKLSINECIESVEECGAPIVSICGGEPLLYPNISVLIESLIKMKKHIYLCTNGILLKDMVSDIPLSDRLILNVHLDGQENVHDAITGMKGSFEHALKGIIMARKRGFRVSTNTTIYKDTNIDDIIRLFERLRVFGVESYMIAPGYEYEDAQESSLFNTKIEIREKLSKYSSIYREFPLSNTPIYMDFLVGKRELECSAWGTPTRNPSGWRSPCYALADNHYKNFYDLINKTDWESYGPNNNTRCKNCMIHSGFEPSAVIGKISIKDRIRLIKWQVT